MTGYWAGIAESGIAELYSALGQNEWKIRKQIKSRLQLGDPRGGIRGGICRILMRRG